ncbi:reverse transcriptase domain-containing protein [Tanacetum coccineum]|uniref:Reverse transcriptase domain-containing protein n=1 Tax=Tanacetum coccineum TaxID=301880 RepID=A0ABQ5IDE5_9ASTR
MLKRCEDTNLSLNWEGIVLGHKISKSGLEVDRAKVEDFSKIARPMTHLLEKETPFFFSEECIDSFNTLKRKLTEAPILIAPDWDLPFEIMCDDCDFAIGAVLGQRKTSIFNYNYASKTMNEAQTHYTTTEKELLAVVYAFEKFRSYLVMSKSIVYTDHSAIKYHLFVSLLLPRRMLRPRLMPVVLFLQGVIRRCVSGQEALAFSKLVSVDYWGTLWYSRIVKALDSVIFNSSFTSSASFWEFRTDNQEKDEKQSQNDKTGLGMEKTVKDKAKSKPESQSSQKVNRKDKG